MKEQNKFFNNLLLPLYLFDNIIVFLTNTLIYLTKYTVKINKNIQIINILGSTPSRPQSMYSQTTVIGLMDEAYFVPKKELLNWVQKVISLDVACIEDLGSGAVYCQLLDFGFGQKVPMNRVNWKAKFQYDFVNNLKIFQQSLDKLGITKKIDLKIQKLARAKYQDNLELIQWLKRYIELNGMTQENYNALERRGNASLYSITKKKKALGTSFKTNSPNLLNQSVGPSIFMDTSICSGSLTSRKPSRVSLNRSVVVGKENRLNESKPSSSKLNSQMNEIKNILLNSDDSDNKIRGIHKVIFGYLPQVSKMEIQEIDSDEECVI